MLLQYITLNPTPCDRWRLISIKTTIKTTKSNIESGRFASFASIECSRRNDRFVIFVNTVIRAIASLISTRFHDYTYASIILIRECIRGRQQYQSNDRRSKNRLELTSSSRVRRMAQRDSVTNYSVNIWAPLSHREIYLPGRKISGKLDWSIVRKIAPA